MSVEILVGDCREVLRTLAPKSVQSVVTSPPYWGLRDYKIAPSVWGGTSICKHRWNDKRRRVTTGGAASSTLGNRLTAEAIADKVARSTVFAEDGFCRRCGAWRGCFGLEPTYQLYLDHMVEIFAEVWRVLRDDGTLWVNMGDCYATSRSGWSSDRHTAEDSTGRTFRDKPFNTFTAKRSDGFARSAGGKASTNNGRVVDWGYRGRAAMGKHGYADGEIAELTQPHRTLPQPGLKRKDLAGMPWRVAFALQDAGWYLRRDIIWHKPNPMPESVYDRPTTSHEYLFLFSKSGDTLLWRHEDGRWTTEKPEPEFYWRDRETRAETKKRQPKGSGWIMCNRWRGFDYYYDFAAIMEPSSPDSHARAARSRSADHKWADGGPLAKTRGPQSIAIGSPSPGRLPAPAGWSDTDGHHGSIHPDGRRRGRGDPDGVGMERWNAPGPNSRVNVDRVPRSRKAAQNSGDYIAGEPRPKSNGNWDLHLATSFIVPMRNKRSVWKIATKPFKEAHFATFPPDLVVPCILAGCPKGGVVLDLFGGAGTVGLVAQRLGRRAVLIELNPKYAEMARKRLARDLMGPEEKRRANIKADGKLKKPETLPLFSKRRVTRDTQTSAEGNSR
jgi:DNA modification methylase